jgi:hypothetical protein
MDEFRDITIQLTADINSLLDTSSMAEWTSRFAALKPRILAWRTMFDALPDAPSEETLAAIGAYTSALSSALMKKMTFRETAAAAGGKRRSTRRRRRVR